MGLVTGLAPEPWLVTVCEVWCSLPTQPLSLSSSPSGVPLLLYKAALSGFTALTVEILESEICHLVKFTLIPPFAARRTINQPAVSEKKPLLLVAALTLTGLSGLPLRLTLPRSAHRA